MENSHAIVLKHLSTNEAVSLVVKGHQIIEIFLDKFIETLDDNPKERLTFSKKLKLAKKLHGDSSERPHYYVWLWNVLSELNSLRNTLAHELEPQDLGLRIQKFVKASEPYIVRWHWATKSKDIERVQEVLWVLCVVVFSLIPMSRASDRS